MEDISGFEERLGSLKQKGEGLVASCTEQVQAKISQQVQAQQQGTRDSYSAICNTAQRVRLQTHLGCWVSWISMETKPSSDVLNGDDVIKMLYGFEPQRLTI